MSLFNLLFGNKQSNYQKGTVDYNAEKMSSKYPVNENGKFGEKGDNSRVIYAKNNIKESRKFYKKVSKGGVEQPLPKGNGVKKIMKDGGVVTHREKTSTPNSPAVDLNGLKGEKVKNQKIHFEKKENKNGK